MSQEPTPAAAAAARDLIVVFRRLRARLRELPSGGLTPSQTSVLVRLHRDGASTTTALALAEGVRSQSMTATLNALDELGLIERAPDPEDGRRHIITLSASGRSRASADKQGRGEWLAREMDRRYSAGELATINAALALLGELADQ
ncbi:MarR family transcriptional regulator [Dactylosporangium sp. CA-139066]|uniref:MarR family transcriptional regulator n=1 Tax=Dactylosporangium sp. CA-139066 TaxID=3239930 RepID=UPI003D8ACAD8